MKGEEAYKDTITRIQGTFKGIWKDIQAGNLTPAEIEAKHGARMEFIEELAEEAVDGQELPEPEMVIFVDLENQTAQLYSSTTPYSYVVVVSNQEFDPYQVQPVESEVFDDYKDVLDILFEQEA